MEELIKNLYGTYGNGDSYILPVEDDKETITVNPKNGIDFQLAELREIVGGHIEVAETKFPGLIMVLDEEGKLKEKPINKLATLLYKYGDQDPIVGDVLICNQNQIK